MSSFVSGTATHLEIILLLYNIITKLFHLPEAQLYEVSMYHMHNFFGTWSNYYMANKICNMKQAVLSTRANGVDYIDDITHATYVKTFYTACLYSYQPRSNVTGFGKNVHFQGEYLPEIHL